MAFQLSPGVNVSEVDLTTVVPSIFTTAGAFAGSFTWGPVNKISLVDSEITLKKLFGKPNESTATSFFTAANFLSYGNNLSVVRSVGALSKNADEAGGGVLIENPDIFDISYLHSNNNNDYGAFIARFAGELGNSITVEVCDNEVDFATWDYKSLFTSAPGTSNACDLAGGANDEMHIVIRDSGAKFSGVKDSVLETFAFLSKASNATENGNSNYYKQVLFNQSKYIYSADPVDYGNTNDTWGHDLSTEFATLGSIAVISLSGGVDDAPIASDLSASYQLFNNKETVDISLILSGAAPVSVQQTIIDLAESRADCVAFVSPRYVDVVNQAGTESTNISNWLTSLARASTYAVADSGWKYQFDVYNNTYRWVPLNGDVAGLCVHTDAVRDPWYSPAGFNRGAIKNCIKLAWNPSKTYRDALYASGVNPVVSFPGQGTVLFGDKTLSSKPSAFDRINVRRLFIILEKTIARAASASLFEQNDDFTRSQFVSTVTPFLRDIQGRRGITDFRVVCDTTNNGPSVIDSNQFVGDIYIKPTRSINYIQLNFIAVATGVQFTTIAGAA